VTAGDVYRALWRHKILIVVLTAAFAGATWYATSLQTQTYEASTLVRAQESGPAAGNASAALQASQDLAQTYAKMIRSGALTDDVQKLVAACAKRRSSNAPVKGPKGAGKAGAPSCGWLGSKRSRRIVPRNMSEVTLTAEPIQDLPLLTLTARSKSPSSALIVADAAAPALREFIRTTAPASERVVTVKAATESSPVSRHLALNIAIAVMLGLIFNGALALLIEFFRDRLPEPDQMEQTLGYPVLATIPALRLHRMDAPPQEGAQPVAIRQAVDGESTRRAAGWRAESE
jgi:capsular polysaccharide biosynthesis protein